MRRQNTFPFDDANTTLNSEHHIQRFALADALRAIAIAAVVWSHLVPRAALTIYGHTIHFYRLGYWGVATFFLLTGFLLSRPFIRFAYGLESMPSIRQYLIRRVLRIMPLYVLALAVSTGLAFLVGNPPTLIDVVAHTLMLQNFSPSITNSFDPPMWTMPIDFEFYVALPLLAIAAAWSLKNLSEERRLQFTVGTLIIGIVVSTIYRAIMVTYVSEPHTEFRVLFLNNGFGMLSPFFIGILLTVVRERPIKAVSRRIIVLGLTTSAVLLFLEVFRLGVASPRFDLIFGNLLCAIASGLFLYCVSYVPVAWQVAASPAIATAASLSYAVYLFHWPIINVICAFVRISPNNSGFLTLTVLTTIIVMPVAYVAHRFVERPFLNLKNALR